MRREKPILRAATWIACAALAIALPGSTPVPKHEHGRHDAHAMSDAQMHREVMTWFAAHAAHGTATIAGAAADTFLVSNFLFNTDGNTNTQIDTARIHTGEAVLFKHVSGSHTTTSGNPGDVNAGSLWDAPIDGINPGNQEVPVMFPNVGTFPFFCRPHGSVFSMKGIVVVTESSVDAPSRPVVAMGFVSPPAPNPTRGAMTFRFALPRAGHARADLYDTAGRRRTTVLDRDVAAGVHTATWDGLAGEAKIAPGVYYLRLTIGTMVQSRRVVIER